jgi:hypothetical protein
VYANCLTLRPKLSHRARKPDEIGTSGETVKTVAVLTREQWLEKYGKCDKESDLPDKPDRPLH